MAQDPTTFEAWSGPNIDGHCIFDRCGPFFETSDNQFGFKKNVGCANAIYVLRSTVDYYVSFGTTENICALDLSKAFDKMNHHGLFIKLIDRNIPVNLLSLLEKPVELLASNGGLLCQDLLNYHAGFGREEYTLAPFICDLYRQRCKESKRQ